MWDIQIEPLFIPYSEFEEVFASLELASNGQIKAQIYQEKNGTELYLANAGRFNVEAFVGLSELSNLKHMKKIWILVFVNRGFIQDPEIFNDENSALLRKQEVLKNFNKDYDEIEIFEKEIA